MNRTGQTNPADRTGQRNQTMDNIRKKRKQHRRQRRMRIFRLLFVLVLASLLVSAVLFVGYALFSWAGHIYQEYQVMYQEYMDRKDARQISIDPKFEGYTNVLILGLDDGVDELSDGGQNADTILVLSFSNDSGRVRFITIPRDTWVTAPDGMEMRISALYRMGGAPLLVREVTDLLGISIHQYIAIDMSTFADLIDQLGGVDIYVEDDMDYEDEESGLSIHLQKGYQHLDGDTAQKYLRYRGSELGDVGRVQRQQKFAKALYDKALQLSTVPKLPAIAEIFQNRVETSAEVFDSAHLANVLRRMSSEAPTAIMLPGDYAPDDDTIWIPDREGIHARMKELFPEMERLDQEE